MGLTGILLAGGKSRRLNFNKIEVRIDKIPLFIDQIFKLSFFCNEILISASENNYKYISNELARIEDYYNRYYFFCNLREIPPVRIIRDKSRPDNPFESMGPISGIESGLENAGNRYSLVIAFDMPFISYNLLYLLEEIRAGQSTLKDAFIIKTEKGLESLCGIYSKNCLNVIGKNIEKRVYKISEIFNSIDTRFILLNKLSIEANNLNLIFYKLNNRKIDSLNFFNINTVDDYNYFVKIWDLQISLYQKFSKQVSSNFTGDPNNLFCEKWKYFFYRQ
ncbi:MAG: molybdenum cofactor guanylyltransferase [Candidatus Humimicrobiaceae bacterium]